MSGVQWLGAILVAAGIVWAFLHPKETGAGEVGFKGLSAKGLTRGGVLAVLGVVLVLAPVVSEDDGDSGKAKTATTTQMPCRVNGTVYDQDTNRPFAGVDVALMPVGSSLTDDETFVDAATTDGQGHFSFDCDPDFGAAETGVLALSRAGWGRCLNVTRRTVRGGRVTGGITLFVSNKAQEILGQLFGLPKNDNCERT